MPFGTRGGISIDRNVPRDGKYKIKIRLGRNYDGKPGGLDEPHELEVTLDGARVELFTIGGRQLAALSKQRGIPDSLSFIADDGLHSRLSSK